MFKCILFTLLFTGCASSFKLTGPYYPQGTNLKTRAEIQRLNSQGVFTPPKQDPRCYDAHGVFDENLGDDDLDCMNDSY